MEIALRVMRKMKRKMKVEKIVAMMTVYWVICVDDNDELMAVGMQ